MRKRYFAELYAVSSRLIDGWAFPQTPLALDDLLNVKRPDVEAGRDGAVAALADLRNGAVGTSNPTEGAGPAGLNTVGLLADRLTVLAMKEWVLRNRANAPKEATALRQTQVAELIDALASVRPGHSSFTQKLTALRFTTFAETWEEAYFGLLSTNVLLWEAQEILYAGKLAELECGELRRYIAWFSEGNICRNEFIARCETTFWTQLASP